MLCNADIDECASGDHNCLSGTATCTNTVGSYSCACKSGYVGDGTTSCVPTGEWYFLSVIMLKQRKARSKVVTYADVLWARHAILKERVTCDKDVCEEGQVKVAKYTGNEIL